MLNGLVAQIKPPASHTRIARTVEHHTGSEFQSLNLLRRDAVVHALGVAVSAEMNQTRAIPIGPSLHDLPSTTGDAKTDRP